MGLLSLSKWGPLCGTTRSRACCWPVPGIAYGVIAGEPPDVAGQLKAGVARRLSVTTDDQGRKYALPSILNL